MITFRRAVRENVGLIIGIAGPSGGGKTLSAMRLAKGMAGNRPFAVIDTEAGRAKHYAGDFTFDHADLMAPFRPDAYADAIKAADLAKYPVIIVDSFSHEHAGDGGLLDWHEEELDRMAKDDWKRRESCTMAAWIKPKMAHKQMVQRLLQVRAHVILCFRAEQKIEMVRVNGKMEIQPKKVASGFSDWIPIAEKNILYELTASFLVTPDRPGIPLPIKLQKQMREFVDLNKVLDESVGQRMADWAKGTAPHDGLDAGTGQASEPVPQVVAQQGQDGGEPLLVFGVDVREAKPIPKRADPQEYITKVKLSQSVRECSEVANEAEADQDLSVPDLKAVRILVSQRMKELQQK